MKYGLWSPNKANIESIHSNGLESHNHVSPKNEQIVLIASYFPVLGTGRSRDNSRVAVAESNAECMIVLSIIQSDRSDTNCASA